VGVKFSMVSFFVCVAFGFGNSTIFVRRQLEPCSVPFPYSTKRWTVGIQCWSSRPSSQT
jgi:hypothetical protein